MRQQLAFTDAVYGLCAGMFFAGYFFFQVPSNLALQRVGARRWIALLMMVWGVISASMVLVSGPRSFYLLRFLLGAAEAGFFPGVILYLKNWFPARARARTVARFVTAAPDADPKLVGAGESRGRHGVCGSMCGGSGRDGGGGLALRSLGRAAMAHRAAGLCWCFGADGRGLFDFRGPGHSRHQCGGAGRVLHDGAVLGDADGFVVGHGGGGRDCVH